MRAFILLVSLLGSCNSNIQTNPQFNYNSLGSDWTDLCKGSNLQSPIDLKTSFEQIDATNDNFTYHYENLPSKKVEFNSSTNFINIDKQKAGTKENVEQKHYFKSLYGKNSYKAPLTFEASYMTWHQKSMHTINGYRMDLEVAINHKPQSGQAKLGFEYGAYSILFDKYLSTIKLSENQKLILDRFLTSPAKAQRVDMPIGELMAAFDFQHRWIYKGSLLYPPCTTTVYWNIFRYVLPITESQLRNLDFKTNKYRSIQNYDDHDAKMIVPALSTNPYISGTIALIVLFSILLLYTAFFSTILYSILQPPIEQDTEQNNNDWKED